ncbi:MAG: DUF4178 domain-containing protein [Burkholderiaceae bacterium]
MSSQRLYRAACPHCGAPVEFRSAGSAMAVCSYCGSTLLRDGPTLRRIGRVAELFDDHSPIVIGAGGLLPEPLAQPLGLPPGAAFVVAGRLQYRYAEGLWSEWSLLFDDGSTLWLSEDNGRHALSRDVGGQAAADVPPAGRLADGSLGVGRPLVLGGRRYEIASIVRVVVHAAAGELPGSAQRVADALTASAERAGSEGGEGGADPSSRAADDGVGLGSGPGPAPGPVRPDAPPGHWIVEARSADDWIASIDYADPAAPALTIGTAVALDALGLRGPAGDEPVRELQARGFSCPSCGGSVTVTLTDTRSIVCPSCSAVIDVSAGQGAELQHYRQQRRFASPLPLGGIGRLFGVDWQAVGFARRSGRDEAGYDFAWSEVLLYHRGEGFAFVVVADDGVSFVRTVQGVPQRVDDRVVEYDGRAFRAESRYEARVDYVEGEFYWQVRRDQRTRNVDYVSGDRVLSREEASIGDGSADGIGQAEVVWSHGRRVDGAEVARAFGMPALVRGTAAGMPIEAGAAGAAAGAAAAAAMAGGRIDAPAYDPNDMPRGLGTAAGSGGAPMPGGAAVGGGGSPTTGSRAIVWLIVIVAVILVLALIFARDDGGGSGGGWYGRSSGGGFSGSHK